VRSVPVSGRKLVGRRGSDGYEGSEFGVRKLSSRACPRILEIKGNNSPRLTIHNNTNHENIR
jgi:hypothetical protein